MRNESDGAAMPGRSSAEVNVIWEIKALSSDEEAVLEAEQARVLLKVFEHLQKMQPRNAK